MQYLVALERPWPTRSPAATPGGPGLPVLEIPGGCSTWSPWSALGHPDHRRPPPGGPGLPVPEIRGGCLVQYLVALERPWPSRAPAAAPRGPGLPVPVIPGGCLVQYLVALERPWPTRAPAAAPRGGSDAM